jgi:hypothetical protein
MTKFRSFAFVPCKTMDFVSYTHSRSGIPYQIAEMKPGDNRFPVSLEMQLSQRQRQIVYTNQQAITTQAIRPGRDMKMKNTTTTKLGLIVNRRVAWLVLCALLTFGSAGIASATESGGSVFPIGTETVLTGIQPGPGQTTFYEYTAFYAANEMDDSHGKSSVPEFKLRVFVNAVKITHNWGWKFLGGTVDTQLALPFAYQQLHIPTGKNTRFSSSNIVFVPFSITNNKKDWHWYYEADLFTPGGNYQKSESLNVGQHNLAIAPVAGFTYLPNKGATEISSRFTYVLNGPNSDTGYHSGNEFFVEFNANQAFAHGKITPGVNGTYYQQTTDDTLQGVSYKDGYKGRKLQIGPQLRFPLGKQGGFALKFYRDKLVRNNPRGGTLWFQLAVPMKLFSHN